MDDRLNHEKFLDWYYKYGRQEAEAWLLDTMRDDDKDRVVELLQEAFSSILEQEAELSATSPAGLVSSLEDFVKGREEAYARHFVAKVLDYFIVHYKEEMREVMYIEWSNQNGEQ